MRNNIGFLGKDINVFLSILRTTEFSDFGKPNVTNVLYDVLELTV